MKLYLGCPVWSFKGWIGTLYPKGTKPSEFLREYARRLTTIEGNTTFYATPAQKTIEAWIDETPGAFRFCCKLPRAISHNGKLAEHIDAAKQFVDVMRQLGQRLGPMFLQLPPTYSPRLLDDLKTFLDAWQAPVRLGVEVRHRAWFDAPANDALNDLLAQHNMARVVIDTRPIRGLEQDKILENTTYERLLATREQKPDLPILPAHTTDFVFLRYIGHPQLAPNESFIDAWADFIATQLRDGSDAYVFCHSPDELIDPQLCRLFYERVSAHVPLPPLPWNTLEPSTPEQARLF